MIGETPREEEQVPVPERSVLLPEAIAALDAKKAKEAQEASEKQEAFDYKAEKAKIEAIAIERFTKLRAIEDHGVDLKVIGKLKEELSMKNKYPTSEMGKKPFTDDELRLLSLADAIDKKREEITKQESESLKLLNEKRDAMTQQSHADVLKSIDEI